MDAAENDLGFPLSEEVRDWFAWSNGYRDLTSNGRSWFLWPNMFGSISLEDAVQEHRESRKSSAEATASAQGSVRWDFGPNWIHLTAPRKYSVVANCTEAKVDRTTPSGLHYLDIMEPEEWHRTAVPSIAELAQTWLQLIRSGAIWFNADDSTWDCRYDATDRGFAWASVVLPWADPRLPRI